MGGVLLVEDDEDIRTDLSAILRVKGFSVRAAANGREALDTLRSSETPCLILLDLMMPDMNGWELRDELQADERLRKVPVVLLSGAGSLEEKARALGVAGYLVKPFELSQLLEVCERYCRPRDGR